MKTLGVPAILVALVPWFACAQASDPDAADGGNTQADASTTIDAGAVDASSADATPVEMTPDAQVPACGDDVRDLGEVCDDGNVVGGDGCAADCLSDESCGNGVFDPLANEICDDSNVIGGDGCSADCLSDESCGNGVFDSLANEVCDDSNVVDGDGCSADCLSSEVCGNGILDAPVGEVCDDSNTIAGDGCALDCFSGAPLVAEDFEPEASGGIDLTGWTMIDVDGRTPDADVDFMTSAWVFGEDGFESGPDNTVAVSTSYYSPTGRADDWLITPQLSLDAHSTLSWRSYAPNEDFRDGYQVRISTTTPDVAGFTANASIFTVSSDATSWADHTVDLAAAGFANQDVYIAFRNNTNDRFLLFIDDVIVE
jgi:cysteine-rich repeat protein